MSIDISPEKTIVNGIQQGSTVSFINGVDKAPVLYGFTITNGYNLEGGGIYSFKSDPIIRNNIITGNIATYGGGISSYYSNGSIINNIIHHNSAKVGGGIDGLVFSANVINNIIYGHTVESQGGGIFCTTLSYPTISNCTIIDNAVTNSNPLYGFGGGVVCRNSSKVEIRNSIIWNNIAARGPQIHIGNSIDPAEVKISYSDVQGGASQVDVEAGCTLDWDNTSMIAQDPVFTNPAINDYHIEWTSPCVNRGTKSGETPITDNEGDPRIYAGDVDIGADERVGDHTLKMDLYSVSAAQGAVVTLTVNGGPGKVGYEYLIFTTMSGTVPGIPLPNGSDVVPVNWDLMTTFALQFLNAPAFQDFYSVLGPEGKAQAVFNTYGPIPPDLVGATIQFAFALRLQKKILFPSNPVSVEINP